MRWDGLLDDPKTVCLLCPALPVLGNRLRSDAIFGDVPAEREDGGQNTYTIPLNGIEL